MVKLGDLCDDVWFQILSFVPTMKELQSFGQANKRAQHLIHKSSIMEDTFERFFRGYHCSGGGREEFRSLYSLERFVRHSVQRAPLRQCRVGVLTEQQRQSSRKYDRGKCGDDICLGYFGMRPLSGKIEQGPVIVWGDFDGVRILESFEGMQSGHGGEQKISSVGEEEESRVLTALSRQPPQDDPVTVFFVGFASGKVGRVRNKSHWEGRYRFETDAATRAHTDEVTSLCFLPCDSTESRNLISGSVDGTVWEYPNDAFSKPIRLFDTEAPVLSMATVVFQEQTLIATVDTQHLSLWAKWKNEEWSCRYQQAPCIGGLTAVTFVRKQDEQLFMVTGSNKGEIVLWRLDDLWELELVEPTPDCQAITKPVESTRVIGQLLFVNAGPHVHIFETPLSQDFPLVYQGELRSVSSYGSAVMGMELCHKRQTMITLARDGTVTEWSYKSFDIPSELVPIKSRNRSRSMTTSRKKRKRTRSRMARSREAR